MRLPSVLGTEHLKKNAASLRSNLPDTKLAIVRRLCSWSMTLVITALLPLLILSQVAHAKILAKQHIKVRIAGLQ